MYRAQTLSVGMRAASFVAAVAVHGLVLLPIAMLGNRAAPPEMNITVRLAVVAEAESEEAEAIDPEVAADNNSDEVDAIAETPDLSEEIDSVPVEDVLGEEEGTALHEAADPPQTKGQNLKGAEEEKTVAPESQSSEVIPQVRPKPVAKEFADSLSDMQQQNLRRKKDNLGKVAKAVPKDARPSKKSGNAIAGKDQKGAEKSGGTANKARYRSIVQSRLSGRKGALASHGGRGTVAISFTIGPTGKVTAASVAKSSGNSAFDSAARSLVASTSFPPPPDGGFSAVVPFKIN